MASPPEPPTGFEPVRCAREQIKYFTTLALPPGHYAIRALVAPPDPQKRGFVRRDLVVPEAGNSSVSPPLFFDKPDQWALLKGVQRDAASYPFLLDGEPFAPSATPLLQPAARTEFALFLYNATAEEMMIRATVTDSAGAKRPAEPTLARRIQGDRVTKLVFELNAGGMSPGPATLDLTLHKKGSSDILQASLPMKYGPIRRRQGTRTRFSYLSRSTSSRAHGRTRSRQSNSAVV